MHAQELSHDNAAKTFVVVFDAGEEVASGLLAFAREQNLTAARFSAIGALSSAMLGWFNPQSKVYENIPIREQVEVLSLVGNMAMQDDEHKMHAHLVVGKRNGQAFGGHLLEAIVRPTLEVMLIETPAHLHRVIDTETRLPLLNLD
ncbi:MAG: PPC domain-containing DNA-binding protein [Planctomycetaceae bacterium]|nr:PPC domain-containing DNA-binding protein [Planctomycetaceae bacterium]